MYSLPVPKIKSFLRCHARQKRSKICSRCYKLNWSNKLKSQSSPVHLNNTSFGIFQESLKANCRARALEHLSRAWKVLSSSIAQRKHIPELVWWCFTLFIWTAKLFVAARHAKILIFWGILAFQIHYHILLSPSRSSLDWPKVSWHSFNLSAKLYALLTENIPFFS